MIEFGEVDLEGGFDIYVDQWDGVMDFRGYSVRIITSVEHSVQLVKNE
jgi:hypothetical protein